jgi:hypothetical protein
MEPAEESTAPATTATATEEIPTTGAIPEAEAEAPASGAEEGTPPQPEALEQQTAAVKLPDSLFPACFDAGGLPAGAVPLFMTGAAPRACGGFLCTRVAPHLVR